MILVRFQQKALDKFRFCPLRDVQPEEIIDQRLIWYDSHRTFHKFPCRRFSYCVMVRVRRHFKSPVLHHLLKLPGRKFLFFFLQKLNIGILQFYKPGKHLVHSLLFFDRFQILTVRNPIFLCQMRGQVSKFFPVKLDIGKFFLRVVCSRNAHAIFLNLKFVKLVVQARRMVGLRYFPILRQHIFQKRRFFFPGQVRTVDPADHLVQDIHTALVSIKCFPDIQNF